MTTIRLLASGLVAALAVGMAVPADPPKDDATVTLQTVKWEKLKAEIAGRKGKVVVIDVWAGFCIPCKREFPHLVELHNKYVKEGLSCISVTVDDKDDARKALAFLKKQKAVFGNYLIDEPAEVWAKKLDVPCPPAAIIFDRSGKKVKAFTSEDPFTYVDVEKVIVPLLKTN
jgi:thiol-disulfide isomerase/thioredoxin